jgi:hypothetical protein
MANRITIEVDRDTLTGGIQVNISKVDENDMGHGCRLAGPKYLGASESLLVHEVTARDADGIRGYLDAVFPVAVWWLDCDNAAADPEVFSSQRAAKDEAIRCYRDANQVGLFDDDPEPDFAWREHRDGGVELYVDGEATGMTVRQLTVKNAAKTAPAVVTVAPVGGAL